MGNNSEDVKKDTLDMASVAAALSVADSDVNGEEKSGVAENVDLIKNKIQSDFLEKLTPNVRKRVEVLRETQSQYDELEAKFFEERLALEAKYQKLYQPLFTKRYEIVNGLVEVEGVTSDPLTDEEESKAIEEKGIPNFWVTAMKSNEVLSGEIYDRDEDALKYLKDVKWCRIDDPKGFKLEFFFDTNPYFKNSVLTKIYHMMDEEEPTLEKAIGTEIEWYPGKCLTQKLLKKKPRKGAKNAKPITKTESCESFFNFFSPPQVPEEDDDDDIDEDAAEDLQNLIEQDYEIGSTIQDKIVPHAVSWFTGEAVEEEFIDLDDDDDDDDEGEGEDDDDEDDEEEEEGDEDEDEDETKSKKMENGKHNHADA